MALLNLEVRAPLIGLFTGDLDYGSGLPTEVLAFVDAGFLWTKHTGLPAEPDRFRSAGFGSRINVRGFIFETTVARVLDRPDKKWSMGVLLRSGF